MHTARTHVRTYARTHARTHAHTHTHTHTIIIRVNIINHMHTQAGGVHKLFRDMTVLTAQAVQMHDSSHW